MYTYIACIYIFYYDIIIITIIIITITIITIIIIIIIIVIIYIYTYIIVYIHIANLLHPPATIGQDLLVVPPFGPTFRSWIFCASCSRSASSCCTFPGGDPDDS